MEYDLKSLREEVDEYVKYLEVGEEGEHLWSNYQRISSILMRLQQIRNDLSYMEIVGEIPTELKKFRTLILDSTIDRFDKAAQFESRKMTGRQVEWDMDKRGGV